MSQIEGMNREEKQLRSLEDMIEAESMVRIIDGFVETLDMKALGFTRTEGAATGRPSYACKTLVKLYVYGYENGVRSSRKLEREARINVEVMWLVEGLRPDYKTISEFRRENIRPLQKIFLEFVKLCKEWKLIGGEVIAVDGTKVKANNSKKRNFNRKKVDDRVVRLEKKIAKYLEDLETGDEEESGAEGEALQGLLERKEGYEGYKREMDERGVNEISTVDPDARLMGTNRGGVDVSYNVQSAVDSKHHLVMAYDVSLNASDHHELGVMVKKVKKQGFKRFKVVADKGYYNGADLERVKKLRVKAIVAKQKPSDRKEQPEAFHTDKFHYDEKSDTYECPMGRTLYAHSAKSNPRRKFFDQKACADCPHRSDCTQDKRGYRILSRSEYAKIYEEADRNYRENADIYKLRQQIVEHPFGTVKHSMHGDHFLLRTRRKVRSEVAMLFLGYNLKRVLKVLGFSDMMARLDAFFNYILRFSTTLSRSATIPIITRWHSLSRIGVL